MNTLSKEQKEYLFDLVFYSYHFFKENYGFQNLKQHYNKLTYTNENILDLEILSKATTSELDSVISKISEVVSESKEFVVACLKYYLIVRYDFFYLSGHFEFIKSYIDYGMIGEIYRIWQRDSKKVRIRQVLDKLNLVLNKLSSFQEKNHIDKEIIQSYEVKDLKVMDNRWFSTVFENVNYKKSNINFDYVIVLESIQEFLKMFVNVLKYLNVKIFISTKPTLISINGFLRKSSPDNFVYMMYFILESQSKRSFQEKRFQDLERYISSLIKNNLLYFGFLEKLYSTDFSEIVNKKSQQILLL